MFRFLRQDTLYSLPIVSRYLTAGAVRLPQPQGHPWKHTPVMSVPFPRVLYCTELNCAAWWKRGLRKTKLQKQNSGRKILKCSEQLGGPNNISGGQANPFQILYIAHTILVSSFQ